ncbi:hypothetical protein [Neorhizobium alkalisoli]|uniref:hypothetical protein n=1 Tax=Neorhizobium alkalisoli TaxID=528178 RepID=UPI000CFA2577|nr:hypothetical protein [Neorhizobium alkalisoli]
MITITGVPERELPNVLRSISIDGLTVTSIEKVTDGTYTIIYGPEAAKTPSNPTGSPRREAGARTVKR